MGLAYMATEDEVRALTDELQITFPNVYDPDPYQKVAVAFDATGGVPRYVFLDKAGRIAHTIRGAPHDVNDISKVLLDLQQE